MKLLLTTHRIAWELRNPIAVLDLASFAASRGWDVSCRYATDVADGLVDVIGLSVLHGRLDGVLRAVQRLKKSAGAVILGGKWTQTLTSDDEEQLAEVCNVIKGPGELFFSDAFDLAEYPSWRQQDLQTLGTVCDEIMTSRGCPFSCNFCHNTERAVRFFSASRTVENIQLLWQLGHRRFFFVDDVFGVKTHVALDILAGLETTGIDIRSRNRFFVHTRTGAKAIPVIKAYCPEMVEIGVESGDDRMLHEMGKGITAAQSLYTIRQIYEETKVPINMLFLIGFPGETRDSLEATYRFAKKARAYAKAPVHVSFYQPVPGTVGFQKALDKAPMRTTCGRNTEISWLEPALSESDLLEYRTKIRNA